VISSFSLKGFGIVRAFQFEIISTQRTHKMNEREASETPCDPTVGKRMDNVE
jgi:hypothetical protein